MNSTPAKGKKRGLPSTCGSQDKPTTASRQIGGNQETDYDASDPADLEDANTRQKSRRSGVENSAGFAKHTHQTSADMWGSRQERDRDSFIGGFSPSSSSGNSSRGVGFGGGSTRVAGSVAKSSLAQELSGGSISRSQNKNREVSTVSGFNGGEAGKGAKRPSRWGNF